MIASSSRVLVGDARERLQDLDSASVQTVVTSPPYFGLRDYGVAGQIGLEDSPTEYVAELVALFREVRRVLRDDGTVWLNLGDSYATSPQGSNGATSGLSNPDRQARTAAAAAAHRPNRRPRSWEGVKPKDLLLIPATVALALRADGWYVRQEVVWAKTAPMPESVRDRCTRSHETVFMLSKRPRYFYDAEAIAEPSVAERGSGNGFARPARVGRRETTTSAGWTRHGEGSMRNARDVWTLDADERAELEQLRAWRAEVLAGSRADVWTLGPEPSDVEHFAVMPTELARRCILAGSSPQACGECGAPWTRIVERVREGDHEAASRPKHLQSAKSTLSLSGNGSREWAARGGLRRSLGWEPTCEHEAEATSCVVLDPFAGAGTTGVVAVRLGRSFVGVELSAKYAAIAEHRIGRETSPLFAV